MTAPPSSPAAQAQLELAGFAEAVVPQIQAAFRQLDVHDLKRSLPSLRLLIVALVHKYGQAAGTLAVTQYQQQRAAAGLPVTGFRPTVAPLPTDQQIAQTVDWATQPLWAAEPDVATAEAQVEAATERLVLDVARDTTIVNTQRDKKALGWERVTEVNPCAFCALLATRGAVYRSEKAAEFKSHDNCRCHAAPDFGGFVKSEQAQQWEALYRSIPHGSPKDMRAAFQKAYRAKYPGVSR